MGKITEITVTKGRSVNMKTREEWQSAQYTVKATITGQEEAPIATTEIEHFIDERLGKLTPTAPLPQLDPEELARLPWKSYQTKQPCKPGKAGWIFSNVKGAEALLDLIKKQGEGVRVQMGPHAFDVKLSGDKQQFIGRAPVKNQKPTQSEPSAKIEDLFSEDLRQLLSFNEEADAWILKPRQFLGTENFAKIVAIVKHAGGEYVSAGKMSHFKIPKKTA